MLYITIYLIALLVKKLDKPCSSKLSKHVDKKHSEKIGTLQELTFIAYFTVVHAL